MKILKTIIKDENINFVELLLYFYVLFLPVRINPFYSVVNSRIQYADLLFPLLFVMFIFTAIKRKAQITKTYIYLPIVLYVAMHFISTFNSIDATKSLFEVSGVVYLSLLCFVIGSSVYNKKAAKRLLAVWMIALGVVLSCALIGLIEVYVFKKTSSAFVLTNFHQSARYRLMHSIIPRVGSTLGNPNMLMSYFVVSIGLLMVFLKNAKTKAIKVCAISMLILILFVSLFTVSRGIVALLVCIFVATGIFEYRRNLFLVMGRYCIILIATVLLAVFLVLTIWEPSDVTVSNMGTPTEKSISVSFHRTSKSYFYKYALSMIRDHPFIGVGSGNFNKNLTEYYDQDQQKDLNFEYFDSFDPHSTYLGLAAETGLLGLLSFLSIISLFLGNMVNILKNTKDQYIKDLSLILIACVVGLLVQAICMDIQNLRHLWLVLGLGIALTNLEKKQQL